ncbi:MAG: hypothetical protein WCS70_06805 [Verrucomicrobiota bacterium]
MERETRSRSTPVKVLFWAVAGIVTILALYGSMIRDAQADARAAVNKVSVIETDIGWIKLGILEIKEKLK